MADFFSEVQASVPTDTFEMFGITQEGVKPDESVIMALDAWLAGEGEEPDLNVMWPQGAMDAGIALGTSGAIGAKYGDNQQVADWVDKQRYSLGKSIAGDNPKAKGRMGTMWQSGFYKGQQTAIQQALEGGQPAQAPAQQPAQQPTPEPTPQPGGVPDLIRQLSNQSVEQLDLMLEVGHISQDQYDEALAIKGIARQ